MKEFFEVFPALELKNDIRDLMEEVKVTKVTSNSRRDFIKVYLFSKRLIEKNVIYEVENELVKQLFSGQRIQVKILEKFSLSSQYTVASLIDQYYESILLELKNYNQLLYQMFYHADLYYPEESVLKVVVEDTILAEQKMDELGDILEKILCERCGLNLRIVFDKKDAVSSKSKEHAMRRMEDEVVRITQKTELMAEEHSAVSVTEPEEKKAAQKNFYTKWAVAFCNSPSEIRPMGE